MQVNMVINIFENVRALRLHKRLYKRNSSIGVRLMLCQMKSDVTMMARMLKLLLKIHCKFFINSQKKNQIQVVSVASVTHFRESVICDG
jgi:hypothetical protein